MALFSIFRERPEKTAALTLYGAIVAQSRRPEFYSQMGVDDTVDGRFEILVLHAGLVMRRLTPLGGRAARVSQALFDVMFQDLDHTLREMGVGDVTVPRRIKEMSEAFYGRSVAYDRALAEAGLEALAAALFRNVYRGQAATAAGALARYAHGVSARLASQSADEICDGRVQFPELEELG